jgi:hypothetical protein
MTYTNLSFVAEYLLGNGEKGIKARTDIPAGTIIGIYDGELRKFPVKDDRLVDGSQHKYIIQIAREDDVLFALHSPDDDEPFSGVDYLNHSCHPNVSVRDRVVLVTTRLVSEGEPLVADYRSWDLVPEGVPCWCTPSQCRI